VERSNINYIVLPAGRTQVSAEVCFAFTPYYYGMSHNLKKLLADFLEDLEIGQGRSPRTVQNYDRYLKRFLTQQKVSGVAGITSDAVRHFRRWLNTAAPRPHDIAEHGVSLATQNYHLIALRQFLRYLARRDVAALPADKVGLAKLNERDIDVLYPEEIDALLTSPSGDELGPLRDRAILEVLFSTGMRVAEVVSLNRDDLRKETNELAVRGKGNKVRVVFLSTIAQEASAHYLARRDDIDPALFVRHGPNSADRSDLRITPRSIQRMIRRYAVAAGLTKKVTPHTLRHSFATDLLSNGADVRQVQQLLGHSSITTTQVYTHLTDVHLRDVHTRYHRAGRDSNQ
jgi:site-specific recombinase XerD